MFEEKGIIVKFIWSFDNVDISNWEWVEFVNNLKVDLYVCIYVDGFENIFVKGFFVFIFVEDNFYMKFIY